MFQCGAAYSAVLTEHKDAGRFNEVVVRSQLLAALVGKLGAAGEVVPVVGQGAAFQVLEVFEEVSAQKKFQLAAMRLVDELAHRYKASRVGLGWLKGRVMKTVAVSGVERFEGNSGAVAELEALFEECAEQEVLLDCPSDVEAPGRIVQAHKSAMGNRALVQVVSLPLVEGGRLRGVLTMEYGQGGLSREGRDEIVAIVDQVAKWLTLLFAQERKLPFRILDRTRESVAWWLGPRNTLAKFSAIFFVLLLVAGSLVKIDYKLDAPATLESSDIGYVSAPYNGHIQEVYLDAGDLVDEGNPLMELNSDELRLRESEEKANLERFTREAEKARSGRKLVDMKVALSRAAQTEIELERIRYYLGLSKLLSPVSGVVVEGNRFELEGSPVAQGDVLMKVANPEKMFVQVKLGERDVDFLPEKGSGVLRLLTQPKQAFPFEVTKLVPAAQVDPEEGNVFIVHGELSGGQYEEWWRPGMSGTVKIDAGKRSVLGVLFHRTWDAIRMWLWF